MKKNLKKTLVKKSILPAAFAVMGSAIALTSVSYAWFTTGNAGHVEELDLKINAVEGLQISADAKNPSSTITLEDLTDGSLALLDTPSLNQISGNNDEAQEITPVSTTFQIGKDGEIPFYACKVEDDATLTSTVVDGRQFGSIGSYTAFDLYFHVNETKPGTGKTLQLNASSWIKAEGNKVQSALRIGFAHLGNGGDSGQLARKLKGKALTAGDIQDIQDGSEVAAKKISIETLNGYYEKSNKTLVWEPFAETHTRQGKDNYKTITGSSTLTGKFPTAGIMNTFTKQDPATIYSEAKAAVEPSEHDKARIVETNAVEAKGDSLAAKVPLFKLCHGINKVRVYLWVEGQDFDCNNDVSGGTLKNYFDFILE